MCESASWCMHTHTHTHTHTHRHTHVHYSNAHTYTHTLPLTHCHLLTLIHSLSLTHPLTHSLACVHARVLFPLLFLSLHTLYKNTRTHTHTHTPNAGSFCGASSKTRLQFSPATSLGSIPRSQPSALSVPLSSARCSSALEGGLGLTSVLSSPFACRFPNISLYLSLSVCLSLPLSL